MTAVLRVIRVNCKPSHYPHAAQKSTDIGEDSVIVVCLGA